MTESRDEATRYLGQGQPLVLVLRYDTDDAEALLATIIRQIPDLKPRPQWAGAAVADDAKSIMSVFKKEEAGPRSLSRVPPLTERGENPDGGDVG